jgi:LmbE family N-acetylglucosaminyl deacetylase
MTPAAALAAGPRAVLVLAPHPDDEALGCGLLLAERWRSGRPAHVACLTDGAASHASAAWPPARLAALRRAEMEEALRRLGGVPARDLTWMGHPDAALDRLHGPGDDLARGIAALVDRLGAGALVVTSPQDPHCDHLAAARAAARVAASRPGLALWTYPVWSRWRAWAEGAPAPEGQPLDLPRHRAAKRAAIGAHRSQMGGVIADDPGGFRMPPGFAERFAAEPEIYAPVPT